MKVLQLFQNENEMIASDGIMHVDGRFNISRIKDEVRERNNRFRKNYSHKLADGFAIYNGNCIRNGYGRVYNL